MEQIKGGPQTIPAPKVTSTPPTTGPPKKEDSERSMDKEKARQAAEQAKRAEEARNIAAVAAFEKEEQEREKAEKQRHLDEEKTREKERKRQKKEQEEERAKRVKAYRAKLKEEKAIRFYNRDEPYYEFTNFWVCNIRLDDRNWSTTEHYFQAQKFQGRWLAEEAIRLAPTPRDAFDIARRYDQLKRADWEDVKDDVMHRAVNAKFQQNKDLRLMLLRTGSAPLVEHTRNDNYWGDGLDGTGKNMLGKLLMLVREEMMPGFAHELEKVPRDDGRTPRLTHRPAPCAVRPAVPSFSAASSAFGTLSLCTGPSTNGRNPGPRRCTEAQAGGARDRAEGTGGETQS